MMKTTIMRSWTQIHWVGFKQSLHFHFWLYRAHSTTEWPLSFSTIEWNGFQFPSNVLRPVYPLWPSATTSCHFNSTQLLPTRHFLFPVVFSGNSDDCCIAINIAVDQRWVTFSNNQQQRCHIPMLMFVLNFSKLSSRLNAPSSAMYGAARRQARPPESSRRPHLSAE